MLHEVKFLIFIHEEALDSIRFPMMHQQNSSVSTGYFFLIECCPVLWVWKLVAYQVSIFQQPFREKLEKNPPKFSSI